MTELNNTSDINAMLLRINQLEQRIARLEGSRVLQEPVAAQHTLKSELHLNTGSVFESHVGEKGLSWLGNIVLFVGITFIVQYVQRSGQEWLAMILGYLAVAGIFGLGKYLRRSYAAMAGIFNMNGFVLLFYVTLRLHFFSDHALITNDTAGVLLSLLVVGIQFFLALKRDSARLFNLAILMLGILAVVVDQNMIGLSLTLAAGIMAVAAQYRKHWTNSLYLTVMLVYIIQMMYLISNPLMGHKAEPDSLHKLSYIFLILAGTIFSIPPMINDLKSLTRPNMIIIVVLNGIGFAFLLFFFVMAFYADDYAGIMGLVSALCLAYSVVLQLRSEWKTSAALYALFGYVTLSTMVYGIYAFPDAYFLLAIQSLLVVSMAIWFRSKFIVIMNFFLFVMLLIFYLGTPGMENGVNLSFSLVALVTARILNWKRDRLTITTNMLRNGYLISGFVMVLITLYQWFPAEYITLSWALAAVLYMVLSLALHNVKYRYMALGTMIAAILYFFIIDLATTELVYRIIALMFLAIVSIGISIYYTNHKKQKAE